MNDENDGYFMLKHFDRARVRESFHRGAAQYDDLAEVQKRVISRFTGLLAAGNLSPRCILDVGCGTGMLLDSLAGIFPHARLFGVDLAPGMCAAAQERLGEKAAVVAGDAEHLPFADCSFDLVVSTSTFQWLDSLQPALAECLRVLRPGGELRFTLFGEKTLFELTSSWRRGLSESGCSLPDRTHRFFTASQVEASLSSVGFSNPAADSWLEVEHHADVPQLLRSLRGIGAGNAAPVPGKGLAGRRAMLAMMEIYRREFGTPQGIPATYEVVCASAVRPR